MNKIANIPYKRKAELNKNKNDKKELIILYTNNFHSNNPFQIQLETETVRDFYVDLVLALNTLEHVQIANHFGNSIILRNNPVKGSKISDIIDFLVPICYDNHLRMGMHIAQKETTKTISSLNLGISEKLKDLNKEKLFKVWPMLKRMNPEMCENHITNKCPLPQPEKDKYIFFDESEIFETEIYYSQYLASLMKEPLFIVSDEIIDRVSIENEINKDINLFELLSKINANFKNSSVSIPFPYYDKSNDHKEEQEDNKFAFVIYPKAIQEKINSNFFFHWRKEKIENQKLYIAYLPADETYSYREILDRRKEVIKNICNNNPNKNSRPRPDIYYFDMSFCVYGYVKINFAKSFTAGITYKENIKKYPKLTESFAKEILNTNLKELSPIQNRRPYFIFFSSFLDFEDETNFRYQINKWLDEKIYFRTEDIFKQPVIKNGLYENWIKKRNSEITFDRNNEIDHYDEELKSFADADLININKKNRLFVKTSKVIDSSWYILIVFNLESIYLNKEQDINFLKNSLSGAGAKNFENISNNFFRICSYGILRGTWDGYLLCNINSGKSKFLYSEIISKLLELVTHEGSFMENVVTKCELYFLKPFIKDDWSNQLIKKSVDIFNDKMSNNK